MSQDVSRSSGCPMCGVSTAKGAGAHEVELRIHDLEGLAADLEAGRVTIQQLQSSHLELCASCSILLEGISDDSEKGELGRRIAQDLRVLKQLQEENAAHNRDVSPKSTSPKKSAA